MDEGTHRLGFGFGFFSLRLPLKLPIVRWRVDGTALAGIRKDGKLRGVVVIDLDWSSTKWASPKH